MSFPGGVIPRRVIAASTALAFALCLFGLRAAAQTSVQPKDEIFGGYSWLAPNGWGDLDYKIDNIPNAFDASNTYYFPGVHNLGFVLDGSGHFNGATTPANPFTTNDKTGVGYALGGLQYKYHTSSLSPFVRFLVGAANLSPDCCHGTEWSAAVGGGGGVDWSVWHGSVAGHDPVLSIRLAQVDYIYSNYSHIFSSTHPTQWNSVRLAAGLVLGLGNYYTPPLTAACTAQPSEVMEGEPVTVTATGTGFSPKHTVTYAWTTNGGKLDNPSAQTAKIDTTGVAGGSYTANATISDPKVKKGGTATCSAPFTVKPKPMNPPVVSCSVNPATVQAGTAVTVTSIVSSPDSSQITNIAYQASSGNISGTGNIATLDTTGLPAGAVTITVTATDARNLTNSGTCTVNVEHAPPRPEVTPRTPIQFIKRPHQRYVPWRIDNEAKAILDDDATALKNDPNAKLVIVGYADGEPQPMVGTGKKKHAIDLAAQRAENAKAYLVKEQGIDSSRIEVRKGTGKDHVADIFWVPQGADTASSPLLQNTTPVDESVVKPSENAYPKPKTAATVHHRAKKAAAPQP